MRLIESFFLGLIAAFGSLVVEFFLYSLGETLPVSTWQLAIILFIGRAFIEEFLKCIIIYKKIGHLYSRGSILLNSAFVGLGFAATEFFLLYSKSGIKLINDLKPLAGVALVHVATALIAGYIISTNRHGKVRIIWKIIAINLLIHLAYNFLALERIL